MNNILFVLAQLFAIVACALNVISMQCKKRKQILFYLVIGNTMVAVVVNDEYIGVDYVLNNKDRIRIITDDLSFGPREDWIEKAQTTYAKRKIKNLIKNKTI